jgi:GT2 family glycosyltransferase
MAESGSDQPLVSVIVPTYNRVPQLVRLLEGLARQTVPAGLFEVIVSDDGSDDPVAEALQELDLPYAFTYLRQDNAGPATARNRAIERARGRLALILNDDGLVAEDLMQVHLQAHSRRNVPVAVLGSFPFIEESQKRPFVRLMEETNLLFAYSSMTSGRLYDWKHFWTCNISLPIRALTAVGGFDEDFREAICEDIELGYRLGKIDIPVLYIPKARCLHDHDIDPERYARRQIALGRNVLAMCEKHPESDMCRVWGLPTIDPKAILAMQQRVEMDAERAESDLEKLRSMNDEPLPEDRGDLQLMLDEMESLTQSVSVQRFRTGLVEEWIRRHGRPSDQTVRPVDFRDTDSGSVVEGEGSLTSIIIPCINGFEHTRRCLDSIAAHTPQPHEVLVVDNGSDAGTLAALRARDDITLLEMEENIGAPAARNRALEVARGDPIVFLDNDTMVTPRWLELLAAHTWANPRVGLVGPMSNNVSGTQFIDDDSYDPERLDEYASARSAEHAGDHHYTARLILFALLVRRRVLETIGGFDTIFGRWGFEDDDFSLRAAIAGFRLRVAEDVFIHHTGSQTSVAAKLDYTRFLEANWDLFKKKWSIDGDLAYGAPYPLDKILQEKFDPNRHVIPIGHAAAREGP